MKLALMYVATQSCAHEGMTPCNDAGKTDESRLVSDWNSAAARIAATSIWAENYLYKKLGLRYVYAVLHQPPCRVSLGMKHPLTSLV